MIPWLDNRSAFPDVSTALKAEDGAPGLLAAGGDLSTSRLLDAYRHGIFPWFSEGQPILWWSPDPRMVLYTDRFIVSHSLRKKLRQVQRSMDAGGTWQVRFDTAFEEVMRRCAEPRSDGAGTWISEGMINAYTLLHGMGYAHSSEVWKDGELVGGAYGMCIGRMFYGESMFARVGDASKIALAYLVHFLKTEGVPMIDCQQETSHLASLGAIAVPRREFVETLKELVCRDEITSWRPIDLFSNEF